jgi:hypothetical protein
VQVGRLDEREITTSLGKRLLMILSPFGMSFRDTVGIANSVVFMQTTPITPDPELQVVSWRSSFSDRTLTSRPKYLPFTGFRYPPSHRHFLLLNGPISRLISVRVSVPEISWSSGLSEVWSVPWSESADLPCHHQLTRQIRMRAIAR